MIRVAVTGAAGRMGRTLIEAVNQAEGLVLSAAIVEPGSSLAGADAGELAGQGKLGVALSDSLEAVINDFDVLIDFTAPVVTLANLKACAAAGKKMVIGTTGLTDEQKAELQAASDKIAIMFASNMSVGVNLCFKLLEVAAKALGDDGGFVKTIFDAKTGELLGAHMVGPEVTELIQGYAIARTLEATEAELMATIFPHPTLSEAMHESVLDAYDRAIHF